MNFEEKLKSNLAEHQLLGDSKPVIAAVSGGADSVALLVGLHNLGWTCIAAHCNYHLRGEESNRDMRAVQSLCQKLGIDLYVRDYDVEGRRKLTGESIEMACRELRYGWFADLLDRERAQAIAVAHHREDNIETFFINLMRGSGLTGLTGMRWRNGYVIRPLLNFSRKEIEEYLAEKDIEYVNDSTNAENDFVRNRLRNIILPAFEANFGGSIDGMLASIGYLAENRAMYEEHVNQKRQEYLQENKIDLALLLKKEENARLLLFEWLRPMGFNITHIDNIIASSRRSGLSFTASGTTLELDRGVLRIAASGLKSADQEIRIDTLRRDILWPVHVVITEHAVAEFKPERDPKVAYFDASIMQGAPQLTLRHWRRGDRMTPYGMEGSKLVSDMFADAKYSAEQKRQAWLLTLDGEVIWVLGLRQSARCSIVPETRRYIELRLK